MKQSKWTILSNEAVAWRTYKMVLQGDTAGMRPGQFVELALPAFFLRRPISVCDIESDRLTLIYKVVGEGTAAMAEMPAGMELDILTCLGNGYDLQQAGDEVLLVGGGVGVPPLIYAAKQLLKFEGSKVQKFEGSYLASSDDRQSRAKVLYSAEPHTIGKAVQKFEGQRPKIHVVLGFNSKREVFGEEEFRRLGCHVDVCTMDGTYGTKGVVTDVLGSKVLYSAEPHTIGKAVQKFESSKPFYYACGPLPMLKALVKTIGTRGQISMEERMGCGVGICVGCSIQTTRGIKRVCKEGPVFDADEILFEK